MASGAVPIPAFGDGSSYVRISDGTLIQWGYQSLTITSGNAYADAVITYPVTFHASTGNPMVTVSNAAWGTGTSSQSNVCIPSAIQLNASGTLLSSFTLRVWKQASVGTENNPEPLIIWTAIGRWK